MTIDCCSVFNELDVLELRLRELDDLVSVFIVVQGLETHAGDPKPLYVDLDAPRWAPWRDRMVSVTVPRIPNAAHRWIREAEMRHVKNAALDGFAPDDLVILSCVDEIPDTRILRERAAQLTTERWLGFWTDCFYYYLNLKVPKPFPCIQYARVDTVRALGADVLSQRCRRPPIGVRGGWHFSYLGGVEAIQTKLAAFAHAEYDTPHHKDPAWLTQRIAERRDPFGLPGNVRYTVVGLDAMPDEVRRHPDRYEAMLLSEVPA